MTIVQNLSADAAVQAPPSRSAFTAFLDRHFASFAVWPSAIIMLLIFGLPLAFSLYLSFQGWTASRSLYGGGFVGFENFEMLLTEPAFLSSMMLTLIYTISTVAAEMVLGMGVALLLNREIAGMKVARALLIMPMMMTPIVAALCWKLLLDPEYGFVNFILGQNIVWLGDPALAPFSVALVNVWQHTPYVAILLLAGLRSLPTDPREAAQIDGASKLRIFLDITLPALRPAILVALLLRTIFEFRTFENIYVMTGGGPAGSTNVLSIYTYSLTFGQFDFTLGSAASWIMLVTSVCLCAIPILVFRYMDRRS